MKNIPAGAYIFLDTVTDCKAESPSVISLGFGPFRLFSKDSRTLVFDNDGKSIRTNLDF